MNDYLFSAILLGSSLAIGSIVYFIIAVLINRRGTVSVESFKLNFMRIKRPLRFLMPTLCAAIVIPFLRLPENVHGFISHFIQILLVALFGWVVLKTIYIVRDAILKRYDITNQDNLHARIMHTQMRMIANIVAVLTILLTIALILMTFGEIKRIGVSILASAGIVGIVIGFAAQKTLGNLIAGIQIAIAQPIRLDDVVIVENEWGRIEEITLTFVVVRIWDLRRIILPISYFIDNPFQNWTRVSADLLGTVYIYADYTVPVDEIRNELTRILENSPKWDKKVNVLQVTNATEQTVEIRALMSAPNSSVAWELRCEVREKLLMFLQKNFPESLPRTRIEMDKRNQSDTSKAKEEEPASSGKI